MCADYTVVICEICTAYKQQQCIQLLYSVNSSVDSSLSLMACTI
jgi:hypothetical protein